MKIILNHQVSKDFVSKLKDAEVYREIASLENDDDYKSDENLHIPQDTFEHCLERKNELINITLAQVLKESRNLKLLYFTKSETVKKLVLSNKYIKPLSNYEKEDRAFFDDTSFYDFISNAPENYLQNYFLNQCFKLTDFKNVFYRDSDGPYKKISDERWTQILKFISWNKNIKSEVDGIFGSIKYDKFGNAEDGWSWYKRSQAEDAPWVLLHHLNPSNSTHVAILNNLYEKVAYKVIKPSIESIISIFNKWKYKPEYDKDEKNDDKYLEDSLNSLRELISFKICENNEHNEGLWNFFRTNDDKHLRYGYYRVYNPTLESIKQHYDKDKDLFIDAAIDNHNFYLTRNKKEKEITELFFEYKEKSKNEFIDMRYNHKKTTLIESAPTLFGSYDSFDKNLNEEDLIEEIEKSSKVIETNLSSKIHNTDDYGEKDKFKLIYWISKQIRFTADLQIKVLESVKNLKHLEQQLKEQSVLIKNLKGWVIVGFIALVVLTVLK